MKRPNARKLIVSIHDVSPKFADEIDRLLTLLASCMDPHRIAMLVVPDYWGEAAITQDSEFSSQLRDWEAKGVEMILHGWSHRDDARHERMADRWRARNMTAGEGEFLGLSREQASERLTKGRTLLESILARPISAPISAFVAPAWLYGRGAHAALADCGFDMTEDHMRVWNPQTGALMGYGPVISWASRSRIRIASSLLFARIAPLILGQQKLVRIALHPGDAHVPALMRSIERTIRHFAQRREVCHYADLY